MALSDKRILEEMEKGNVIIEPYMEKHLSTSSYDVTLGEWYFRELAPDDYLHIYNIYSQKHTEKVWGRQPERAKPAREILKNFDFHDGIKPNDKIVLVRPGETILAHTQEFIGGKNCITTMMKARSSLGRNFIEVCKCAGWGDVGFTNRWTMEITNGSRHYTIPLVVGMRIAQIVFFYTGEIRGGDYTKNGKYQTSQSLAELKKSWEPEMMIPKLWRDREKK